jgi:signal transduction histidine kinase
MFSFSETEEGAMDMASAASVPAALRRSRKSFRDWSLSSQFALTGGLIMVMAAAIAGYFVSAIVSQISIDRTASSTALLIESLVAPLAQNLATEAVLDKSSAAMIEGTIGAAPFNRRFPHLDIWKKGGVVAYSTATSLIGRKFEVSPGLATAFTGDVSARYTDLDSGEHVERGFRDKFLEIYIPIRASVTGQIIAVAEIHEVPDFLAEELWDVRIVSWLAVASATLLIMLGLFTVVRRGTSTIEAQRCELRGRIEEIEHISDQNVLLRQRVQNASGRLAEMTEGYMRRIGADLHDGPAQLIGFANLRIEHVRRAETPEQREKELRSIESALAASLDDIRTMSRGLILPEIEGLPMSEVVKRVVHNHELRTGTTVAIHGENISQTVSHAIKICMYRFLQEGLNNAFRHAGGDAQAVFCDLTNMLLTVAVQDSGDGNGSRSGSASSGLGLIGLRERVESLGGTFKVLREPERGTRIEMCVSIAGTVQDE